MNGFECYYAMYIHHRGIKSIVYGDDIVDAIKKSNRNAILVTIFDADGTRYSVCEHDEASPDNYFDYYWVDDNGNILYDERDDKWGYYYRAKAEDERNIKLVESSVSLIDDDIKVKVLAYGSRLIVVPNRPFDDIGDIWYPVNDSGNIGSVIVDTVNNLGVSLEALKLMKKIKVGSDGIGDIDWYKNSKGFYIFSWLCALYRVMDVSECVSARGFRVYSDHCVIVNNDISDDIIKGINSYDGYRWKEPFSVTEDGIKRNLRKVKLDSFRNLNF